MKYNYEIDISLDNAASFVLRNIKAGSRVLEFGPATGYMTRYMKEELECTVYGVEIDEEAANLAKNFCKKLIIADIDQMDWVDELKGEIFDYIIFADVLEHLKNPWKALEAATSFLNRNGTVITSIPNIAHNAIIMELIQGKFDYRPLGLLDETHIRFFTKKSISDLLLRAGLYPVQWLASYIDPENSEFQQKYDSFPPAIQLILRKKPNGNVYQYITISKRKEDVAQEESYLGLATNDDGDKRELQDPTSTNWNPLDEYILDLEEELANKNEELARLCLTLCDVSEEVKTSKAALGALQEQIGQLSVKNQRLQQEMNLIHSSDFWKLATVYYKLRDRVWPFNTLHRFIKEIKQRKKHKQWTTENTPTRDIITHYKEQFINNKYDKMDIIFLSIIDWDYRYQRPQHIASHLLKRGHRIFYVNASFNSDQMTIRKIFEGLWQINFSNQYFQRIYDVESEIGLEALKSEIDIILGNFSIKDAIIIVEYPIWVLLARHLKEKFNLKIVLDFLDDFTGFHTANSFLLICMERIFQYSDLVVAASQFLFNVASKKQNKAVIIRNGADFAHFNQALQGDRRKEDKVVIGYYGAIAEWFDTEKVAFIAHHRPQWDIILIGDYTYIDHEILSKLTNVKLLGEKSYLDLPHFLADFDVCIIPFRTDSNLIQATNPVKFYEYLSAAKKIVATEIPELFPYRDKYVYLSDNNDMFLHYLDLCVSDNDSLAPAEERLIFAKSQEWANRVDALEVEMETLYKKVSIIVVTYNNLEYTKKCLMSIINKTAYPNYEIIVVDNCSNDGTQDYLTEMETQFPNIKAILNEYNYGFARGNNIGINVAKGDYIILLNNDTIVTRGWISGFIRHFEQQPNLGLIGPVTNSIGNEAKINVNYVSVDHMDVFAEEYCSAHFGCLTEIPVLAMFCLATSRKVIDDIGLLDEGFGIGMFEDDDYSYRAKIKGYKIACAEDIFIHHYGGVSFSRLDNEEYRNIFETNKRRFEEKWGQSWIQHKYREGVN